MSQRLTPSWILSWAEEDVPFDNFLSGARHSDCLSPTVTCVFFSDGNFADAVFRFNANISYSGVLHAVTQDVSALPPRQSFSVPVLRLLSHLLTFLLRVCSLRTKRSSSATPSWLCCPRRRSCPVSTRSWRATSRPSDVWWPPRPASRPSPSCPS